MKKHTSLILLIFTLVLYAQDNTIYKAEKTFFKFGKYTYLITHESFFEPEVKESGFSEVLMKGNKKQYLGHFVYQLKSSTEIQISPDNPPPLQIENRILQSSSSEFDYENERITVTTFFYDEKEPKEKEIKILKQSNKGFFYVEQKRTYYKNGEIREEKDLPQKIKFVKTEF